MIPPIIQRSSLWQSTLGPRESDEHKDIREKLRSAYLALRERASQLVSRVSGELPGLTQHDVSHLDALWDLGSLIAGAEYPINALEGFVLGGAISIHDAALCFEAYEGGVSGVRATSVWRDAHAALLEDEVDRDSDDAAIHSADFHALRRLHADQAQNLLAREWIDPATDASMYLVDDFQLRKHFGPLIGQIASSHHWSIEEVASRLPRQVNAIAPFPREWRVNPVKLACLLRCADAAHIDTSRAPDFLHALVRRHGVSLRHWQAQNRIARADLDLADPTRSTLLFASTRPFTEQDADSWWIAYDACCLVDKEIRSANALLESRALSPPAEPFAVRRVRGVESPERLAEYVSASGWTPCSAELHVGNIEDLVRTLGGDQLYGTNSDKLEVSLREIVQNARDAIHARRVYEPGYEGRIVVSTYEGSERRWIVVEDDRIGMSRRVLTGPLLDFGSSFWTSSLVQDELPGLRSSDFSAVGQFGIGFYSSFMVADKVRVVSRRWQEGVGDVNELVFNDGLSFRPILKSGYECGIGSNVSTRVELGLQSAVVGRELSFEIKCNMQGQDNIIVDFIEYISSISAGIDVDILVHVDGECSGVVNGNRFREGDDIASWMKTISFSTSQESEDDVKLYIDNNIDRFRFIYSDGRRAGCAAVSTRVDLRRDFMSLGAVGGLATSVHDRGSDNFIGWIDYKPKSAKRDRDEFAAPEEVMRAWAEEQLQILKGWDLKPLERCGAALSLPFFGVDPTSIARVLISLDREDRLVSMDELAEIADTVPVAILKSHDIDIVDYYNTTRSLDGRALIRPVGRGSFYKLSLTDGVPENNNSVIDCLHRLLVQQGKSPVWELEKAVSRSALGIADALIVSVD